MLRPLQENPERQDIEQRILDLQLNRRTCDGSELTERDRDMMERAKRARACAPVVTGQGVYAKPYTPTVCDVRRDWAALAWGLAPWAVAAALLALAAWIGGGR